MICYRLTRVAAYAAYMDAICLTVNALQHFEARTPTVENQPKQTAELNALQVDNIAAPFACTRPNCTMP